MPFAARRCYGRAVDEGLEIPAASECWLPIKRRDDAPNDVSRRLNELFADAKTDVGAMECRVLPLEDDEKGVRSLMVELYVHVQLSTPYNDFSTS